jgi:RimJ/RimL family protein N-acetyltransferase
VAPAGRLRGSGQPVLPAGALTLRPWAPADAPVLVRAYADPAIRFWNLAALAGPDEAVAAIDGWAADWREERRGVWAVADTASGAVLGRVVLRGVSLAYGLAECTYWTLPEARRRGVAATAARAVSRWALTVVGLHRVELQHSVRNEASCRVARRAGFAAEGIRREALLHADGWHDMHLHAVLVGDLTESPSTGLSEVARPGPEPKPGPDNSSPAGNYAAQENNVGPDG